MSGNSSRRPLILAIAGGVACLTLILLLVLGGVAGFLLLKSGPDTDPAAAPHGTAPVGADAPAEIAEDKPYLEVGTSSYGPVIDVYIDFLCPHCASFHDLHGADLQERAEKGQITLRVHPRPMLDANSSPAGYSGRAANAAVCVYAEDPAQWFAAEDALFENQPGAAGLDDSELTSLLGDATGLDVSACIADGTYLPWIQDVVEPEARGTGQGTPAVYVDGELFTGDLNDPDELGYFILRE